MSRKYQRLTHTAAPLVHPPTDGGFVPHKPTLIQRLGARVVYALIRTIELTLRYRWEDRTGILERKPEGHQFIYCLWHNRLVLCMKAYFGYARIGTQTHGLAALISASKDGGFLTGVFELFGVQPVRGSSSRRGQQALLEMTRWARRGYDLGITPDGPRGPRYVVQEGVIALAQLTGLPIIPVASRLSWKKQLKSWDGFQIPLPFSRCEMIYGKAIQVPREASAEQREALRQELEKQLKEISGE